MFEKRIHLKLDLSVIALFTLYFGLILAYVYGKLYQSEFNLILLSLLLVGTLGSYFAGLNLAFIGALVFDFIYATWRLYLNITTGLSIPVETYFWMLIFPAMFLLTGYAGGLIQKLQQSNKHLMQLNEEFVTVDAITGLKTSNVFFQDLATFMNISKRYDLNVSLMIIEFKYHSELLEIIGKNQFENLIVEISDLLGGTTRYEDYKYVLNDYKKFAVIFVSDEVGSEVLRNRIKEQVNVLAHEDTIFKKYHIELKVGIASVQKYHELPFELIEAAEKDMAYDL